MRQTAYGTAALAFLVGAIVLLSPIHRYISTSERGAHLASVNHAASSIQLAVSTLLEREWDSLVSYSEFVNMDSYDDMRGLSDAVIRASEAIAWVGVADASGIVVAGSGGFREGEDVSERKWFVGGLADSRVGKVYTPSSLVASGDSSDLINLSHPIVGPFGSVQGVALYRVKVDWLTTFIEKAALHLNVTTTVMGPNGELLVSVGENPVTELDPHLQTLVNLNVQGERVLENIGSTDRAASVIPNFITGSMPSVGWTLVSSMKISPGTTSLGFAARGMAWAIIGLCVVIGTAAMIFGRLVLRPMEELVEVAAKLANDERISPPESSSSHEAVILQGALVKLQSKLRLRYSAAAE